MAFDWTDISTLTNAQRTAAGYFENIGKTVGDGPGKVPLPLPPDYTYSQCRQARAFLIEVYQKIEPAMRGVRQVLTYYEEKAKRDFMDANP